MHIINIELDKKEGTGTIKFNGKIYNCGGRVRFNYPKDSIIDGYKEECHYSREYNVPMYYSVLWDGNKGVYIHEWGQLEGSAGCIHLLAPHAKEFYDSINGKARVLFKWI